MNGFFLKEFTTTQQGDLLFCKLEVNAGTFGAMITFFALDEINALRKARSQILRLRKTFHEEMG